jgi:hypothetical protein
MRKEILTGIVLTAATLISSTANADVHRTRTVYDNGYSRTVQTTRVRDHDHLGYQHPVLHAAGTAVRATARGVGAAVRGTGKVLDAALPPYHHHHY